MEIIEQAPLRYAYLRHSGPYPEIGSTFGKMAEIAGGAGLLGGPDALFVGVYHDDPSVTPVEALRSDAGVTLSEGISVPEALQEGTLAGGRFARGVHRGSYSKMSEGWMALCGEMHEAGLTSRMAPCFEVYISDMQTTPEDELITEIYVPIE